MNKRDMSIEELLPLYIEGSVTPELSLLVEQWLAESEEHQKVYEQELALYRDMDVLLTMDSVDQDEAKSKVHQQIRKDKIRVWMGRIERIAAILFIPLLILVVWQLSLLTQTEPEQLMSIRTNPGMTTTTTLPDGTVVTLNANSELTYPAKFTGDSRQLTLVGEAYFSVTKDAKHPFVVSTTNASAIKVYGTKFNLEAYPDQKTVSAILEEGVISMIYKDKQNHECERKILPGEKITYSSLSGDVEVEQTDVEVEKSWISGSLIFKNTSIRNVLHTLSKRYDVNFDVKNPRIYDFSFTGTLEKQRLDRVLEILNLSSGIKFRYKKNMDIQQSKQTIEVY